MGQLLYGSAPAIAIRDWPLRHLQTVILNKIRRDESFAFSWDHEPGVSGDVTEDVAIGRWGTVWISKGALLYFSYDEAPPADLDREWLRQLAEVANSNSGLHLVPQPPPRSGSAGADDGPR